MPRTSIADFLSDFERFGRSPAYAERTGYRTTRTSYLHVAQTAYRFARELTSRGIRKGDRILLWGPNSASWVSVFFACANRGVVAVPIDDSASPDFAVRIFDQVKAKLLVCSRKHRRPNLPVIFFEELGDVVARQSPARLEPGAIQSEDALQIVFTSGTTAQPKGVVISHGNVLSNIAPLEDQIRPYLKFERLVHPVRFLNLLPLSHVFGQFLGMYLPPLLGGTVFFENTPKPADIVSTIRRERISVLVAVPRMLQSLKDKIQRDLEAAGSLDNFRQSFQDSANKHFLRRWWIFRHVHLQFGWKFWAFISGGATLDADTEHFWQRLGFAVIQGYGLTETTSLISVNHPFKVGRGSIGKILAGREVKLAPDGEILVRGGGVASGYWSDGELRPVASEEGWYHTGDIGELDAQGNLFFKGRKKDVIVTPAGMNVYPEDLEAAVKAQPEVKDCVVTALALGGNAEPCAVLILRDRNSQPEAIISHANQNLAEYQRIRRWVVWPDEDFPRTSTQKPRRAEVAATAQKMLATETVAGPSTGVSQFIARLTKRFPASLSKNTRLDSDLNLSSLDRVELLSALEERYQIDLSETGFSSASTIGDLERILTGKTPSRAIYHYPAWVQRWPITWIRFVVHYLLLRPSVFVLGWPRVIGRENLKGVKGPVLIISNHIGDVDLGFILIALPAKIRHRLATATGGEALEALHSPSADRKLFFRIFDRIEWFLGVSLLNLFPLPRQAGFRQSFAFAGESVDRGYSVLVFPEGRHTTSGVMNPFQPGIGLLVKNLGLPVVPMRIDGLFELKQAGKKVARPFQVLVRIGKPVQFNLETAPHHIAAKLEAAVQAL